jgi:uncharacterized protein YbjT (DUF2867 family)
VNGALLAGSTGLVGRELQRQWPGPGALHLLVRKPVAAHAGCTVHVVDFAALPALPAADAAFSCLGTTIKVAGSQAAFRSVDFDAVLAFARAARAAGVRTFAAVSALGANPKSPNFYSRVKGEAEAALAEVGFDSLVLARPSLLAGDREALGQPVRLGEKIGLAITAPLGPLFPAAWRPIQAATVARAMLRAAAEARPGMRVLSSGEMQSLGR